MKKLIPQTPVPVNMLQDIHSSLVNLPIRFREKVCEECSWSVPTFYRKMRGFDKPAEANRKMVPALSNAEKEKIVAVMDEVFREFWEHGDKYRKKPQR
ncbi:hypothetical protein [uncultured Chitinophaga sp.]|jgi:hypothetical protein|uniref:hypothetical protein n=1 Tax=uncultured Chitinophaga sp. TaxID=339340 RepID=UPI002631764D|nr:hypothetical protein [uncultured Chitinophaga sp.]